MNYSIDVVDELVRRTKVSYKTAKEALDAANGDLLHAMIYLEENRIGGPQNLPQIYLEKLRALIDDGMISQIQISKNGQMLFDIPLVVGAAGAAIWKLPALLTLGSALAAQCDIRIVKRDGAEFNFSEVTARKLREITDYLASEYRKIKEKQSGQEENHNE